MTTCSVEQVTARSTSLVPMTPLPPAITQCCPVGCVATCTSKGSPSAGGGKAKLSAPPNVTVCASPPLLVSVSEPICSPLTLPPSVCTLRHNRSTVTSRPGTVPLSGSG